MNLLSQDERLVYCAYPRIEKHHVNIIFAWVNAKKGENYKGYCQKCDKYYPRVRVRHLNIKKQKLDKIRRK